MNYKEDFTMEKKSTKLVARIALALLAGVVAVSTATAKPSLKGFLKSVTATEEDKLVSDYETQVAAVEKACADKDWAAFDSALKAIDEISRRDAVRNLNDTQRAKCAELKARKDAALKDKLVSDYETQVAAVEKACADKDWAAFDSALKAIYLISEEAADRNLNDTQRAKCAELKARKDAAFKTAPAMPENFFKVKLCANDTGVCVTALDTSKEGVRGRRSVIIPPTIQGMPVLAVNIDYNSFSERDIIVVPEGVKYASIDCGSVQLPEGLLYLDCSDITVDNFPSTLKVISGSLRIPKTVEELSFPENLVLNASLRGSVKKVVLPKKMSFVGGSDVNFFEQLWVEDVVIPADHNYYLDGSTTTRKTLAYLFGKFDSILMQKKLKDCKFEETDKPDYIVTWKDYQKWRDDCKYSSY